MNVSASPPPASIAPYQVSGASQESPVESGQDSSPRDEHVPTSPSATPATPRSCELSTLVGPRLPLSTAFSLTPGAVTHILYHANCPDGFGAAWSAWTRLGDKATYVPVSHGDPPPQLPADARVAIVDFSYPRDQIVDLKSRVADLVVLDHHASAQRNLQGLDYAYFDMKHSGARLSWDFFHPDEPVPDLVSYVEDGDLWKWSLPNSHEFRNGLLSYPFGFEQWDKLSRDIPPLVSDGTVISRWRDQLIHRIADRAQTGEIDGHEVPVVNGPPELASDVCHELIERNPDAAFVASWYYDQDGNRQWELRSGGDFDVSKLAEKFGGGGHFHASGFRQKAPPTVVDP